MIHCHTRGTPFFQEGRPLPPFDDEDEDQVVRHAKRSPPIEKFDIFDRITLQKEPFED
jgi:hypothetical protein